MSDLLGELAGAELAAVTFVRDYLQFQFETIEETWILNVYTPPRVVGPRGQKLPRSSGWRDALVDLVNGTVQDARAGNGELSIIFNNDRSLRTSLLPDDQQGPQAASMSGQLSHRWSAWSSRDIKRR